jgi:hypothetical protein
LPLSLYYRRHRAGALRFFLFTLRTLLFCTHHHTCTRFPQPARFTARTHRTYRAYATIGSAGRKRDAFCPRFALPSRTSAMRARTAGLSRLLRHAASFLSLSLLFERDGRKNCVPERCFSSSWIERATLLRFPIHPDITRAARHAGYRAGGDSALAGKSSSLLTTAHTLHAGGEMVWHSDTFASIVPCCGFTARPVPSGMLHPFAPRHRHVIRGGASADTRFRCFLQRCLRCRVLAALPRDISALLPRLPGHFGCMATPVRRAGQRQPAWPRLPACIICGVAYQYCCVIHRLPFPRAWFAGRRFCWAYRVALLLAPLPHRTTFARVAARFALVALRLRAVAAAFALRHCTALPAIVPHRASAVAHALALACFVPAAACFIAYRLGLGVDGFGSARLTLRALHFMTAVSPLLSPACTSVTAFGLFRCRAACAFVSLLPAFTWCRRAAHLAALRRLSLFYVPLSRYHQQRAAPLRPACTPKKDVFPAAGYFTTTILTRDV